MAGDVDGPEFEGPLLDLASQDATGRLLIADPDGNYGWVWLREGLVTGASGPGPRPLLANRLLSHAVMPRARIGKFIAETRARRGLRLFDLLVEQAAVPEEFLTDFTFAVAAEQFHYLNGMRIAGVHFENGRIQRSGGTAVPAHLVLERAHAQLTELPGVPKTARLSASDRKPAPGQSLQLAMVSRADGTRTLAQITEACGLTTHEAVSLATDLLNAELLKIAVPDGDHEPWTVQRPLPVNGPDDGGAESSQSPTSGNFTDRESPRQAHLLDDAPDTQLPDARLPSNQTEPASERDMFDQGLAAAASEALTASEVGPPPPAYAAPPVTEPDPSPAPVEPMDRRSALSDLAALSQEAAADAPVGPSAAAGAGREGQDQSEPTASEDNETERHPQGRFGRRRTPTNPGTASEVFRELRSLADEDDDPKGKSES